jgi:hypothetical protein
MIKKILTKACIYFSVICGAYAFAMLAFHGAEGGLGALRVMLFIPFCLAFGAASVQLTDAQYDKAYRRLLHALLTVGGAILFLLLPAGLKGSQNLTGGVLILVGYIIVVAISSLFKKRVSKALEEDKKYRK